MTMMNNKQLADIWLESYKVALSEAGQDGYLWHARVKLALKAADQAVIVAVRHNPDETSER